MNTKSSSSLLPELSTTVMRLITEFDQIPADRKILLKQLAEIVQQGVNTDHTINLNFICTHNSRRSHLGQIWAKTAAWFYGVKNVVSYSGGTEATAFNIRAVKAMQSVGFSIEEKTPGDNPVYEVRFSEAADPVVAFSKKYDDVFNPSRNFAAIMTCSHADENCPLVLGASSRLALTYDDPKDFDGTLHESAKYQERVNQIGREILFAFSHVTFPAI